MKANVDRGVRLTAKGAGAHEGKFIIGRWAATFESKTAYIYAKNRMEAVSTAIVYFGNDGVSIEEAGFVGWSILDKGTVKERAVKRLFMFPKHDAALLVDNQYAFAKRNKVTS